MWMPILEHMDVVMAGPVDFSGHTRFVMFVRNVLNENAKEQRTNSIVTLHKPRIERAHDMNE